MKYEYYLKQRFLLFQLKEIINIQILFLLAVKTYQALKINFYINICTSMHKIIIVTENV